jgi:beta-galactosidase beta subunit
VVYPEDAHAPGLADGEPAPVKKIVVKVAIA